jgi:hypothetical protein
MKYSDADINDLKMEMQTHKDDMIDIDDDGFCCDDECCYGDDE